MSKITNLMKKMSIFLAALFLMAGMQSESVYAAEPGIYVADCTPNYRHPQTGVIEDTGGEDSFALGQSMTESVTGPRALVEVDEAGNTYVTVRLGLMDNISDVAFLIDGGQANPELIKQDAANNSADYRMLVFSENSVITTSLYVAPMGRYVTYYITLSNLQPGSGDFLPQITLAEQEPAAEESTTEPIAEETPEPTVEAQEEAAPEEAASEEAAPEEAVPEEAEEPVEEEVSESGLQEFDAEGNKVAEEKKEKEETKEKSSTGMWIGIILAVAVFAGGAWYFVANKKKK